MTKIYLDQVSNLASMDIMDKDIKRILELFMLTQPHDYNYLYEKITNLCEPLFNNPELFHLFYNATLYKDFDPLIASLKKVFPESFNYIFNTLLNNYYEHNFGLILKSFKDVIDMQKEPLSFETHIKHI